MMRKLLERIFGREKRVIVFQLGKPMTEKELMDAAAAITTQEAWWRVVMQLAFEAQTDCIARASDPALKDGETKYALGGADAIAGLVDKLKTLVVAARKQENKSS